MAYRLHPCWFEVCGSRNVEVCDAGDGYVLRYAVECKDCRACGPFRIDVFHAATAWNLGFAAVSKPISTKLPKTERQAEVLAYYRDFIQRRAFVPSYMMIARHFGLKSKVTIMKHMHALRRQGLV